MAKLFIITGPAGVGKSTVTKALAEKIGKCAVLEGDEIYHQVLGGEKPWLEGNHLDVMWKNVASLTKNYLEANIDVIFNYIVYRDELEPLLESLAGYEVHFVVLIADAKTITARDEGRDEDVQVHRVEKHLQGFARQGYDDKFYLCNKALKIDEQVSQILSGRFIIDEADF